MADAESVFAGNDGRAAEYDPSPLTHLATAIVARRAIVFVGAGASVPSGAPLWADLLSWLYEEGAKPLLKQDEESSVYLERQLSKEKMFLESADLLQDILDRDLPRFLREKFAEVTTPSNIHLNIGRIPFTAAITTNYDNLLEQSYNKSLSGKQFPDVATWNRPLAILKAIQENAHFVLKTHGGFDDPDSLILSSRQYRDLINSNPLYWEILKWIFLTKTCLFVGCSLTDPDLLQLLGEVITEIGLASFGPHYALLPADEAPRIKVDNLWRQWKIRVIRLEKSEQGEGPTTPIAKKEKCDKDRRWVEPAASKVLVGLAGEVARQTVATRPPPLPTSDDQDFFLNQALRKLLQTAVEVTGSFRGDICLHDKLERRLSVGTPEPPETEEATAELRFRFWHGPTESGRERRIVPRRSVCDIAYYEADPEIGVNIRDVKNPDLDEGAAVGHWGEIKSDPGHTEVRSALAMPILADGVRVGVLNLESRLPVAYAAGHVTAAHWYSEKAGRLCFAAEGRNRRGRALHPTVTGDNTIRTISVDLLRTLWKFHHKHDEHGESSDDRAKALDGRAESLEFLIFYADYIHGTLEAPIPEALIPNDPIPNERIRFQFDEKPAFTGEVFRRRSGIVCRDAQHAIHECLIADKYEGILKLSGPLIGFPIYVRGYTAGVLLCWRKWGKSGDVGWRDMEMFRRALHLIANASGKYSMLKPLGELKKSSAGHGSQSEAEKQKERVDIARQHIVGAQETIDLCVNDPVFKESWRADESQLDPRLYKAWERVTRQVASLLALLWTRYGEQGKNWLVPNRARLWVASAKMRTDHGKSESDKSKESNRSLPPTFCMVVDISLKKDTLRDNRPTGSKTDYDNFWRTHAQEVISIKNLVPKESIKNLDPKEKEERYFCTTQPESSPTEKNNASDATKRETKAGSLDIFLSDFIPGDGSEIAEKEKSSKAWNIPDPDFSFLISRQRADWFTRFQKPDPKGDVMELIKGAGNIPIYAAPITMMVDQEERQSDQPAKESDLLAVEKKLHRAQLCQLVAILALDRSPDNAEDTIKDTTKASQPPIKALQPPIEERDVALQRELLHTIDLFTACLAENTEFRDIGARIRRHAAPPKEDAPQASAAHAGA